MEIPNVLDVNADKPYKGLVMSIGKALVKMNFDGKYRRLPLDNYIPVETSPTKEALVEAFKDTQPTEGLPFTVVEAQLSYNGEHLASRAVKWTVSYMNAPE